ncbi:MAG: peptide-methionine (S)-S-oxide reductase MsrA [Epsilonproteobacteria bacterium]|nr:peptide-methionine (S)-S-oxide reductase MsrA [Campylobacterota bacterium]
MNLKEAYFGGGCFWGIEYLFSKLDGVADAVSGYMGGTKENPTYHDVCYHNTGYIEVVKVVYDPQIISYENLTKYFFEIHDPTQTNGQGPDIGYQYISAVFTSDEEEKKIVEKLIKELESKGYKIATKVFDNTPFWKAEEYHQNYYDKNGHFPYCHRYTKKF